MKQRASRFNRNEYEEIYTEYCYIFIYNYVVINHEWNELNDKELFVQRLNLEGYNSNKRAGKFRMQKKSACDNSFGSVELLMSHHDISIICEH